MGCAGPFPVSGIKVYGGPGLSNYDALKTVTVNPALWFGKSYNEGMIERGKRAGLIILAANPLTDITNTKKIISVIFKGKVVEQEK